MKENILKKAHMFLRKTNIKNRLIISSILFSLVPILIVGIFSYVNTYEDMEKKASEYQLSISSQIVNNITFLIENYVDKFEKIALNSTILADMYNYSEQKEYRQIEVDNRIRFTLASIVGTGRGIDSVEVRTKEGERFYYSTPISNEFIFESKFIEDTYDNDGVIWRVSPKETEDKNNIYIVLAKKMRIQFGKEITGFTLMSIERSYFDEICRQNLQSSKHFIVITDKDGNIISHPNKDKIMTPFNDEIMKKIELNENLKDKGESKENIFKIKTDSEELLVSYGIIHKNKWIVMSIIPYDFLMSSAKQTGKMTIIIAIICIIFSLLFSLLVTDSIIKPVNKLLKKMKRVGKGDFSVVINESRSVAKDEHELLDRGFDDMTIKLKTLINDVYNAKIKEKELEFLKKEAELNALQQQINPHFLYNILEAIFWTAKLNGDKETSKMVTALGDFFRSSINKGLEFITIEEEIKNVKNYIYLQKIRFEERFDVMWQIDIEILKYKIVKLILQPIIENSIIHGIEQLEEKGEIIVKGYKYKENIIIEVLDNGVGMDMKQVKNLQKYIDNQDERTKKSIGIKNVNQRIKLYFGDNYGIRITSKIKVGTKVSIKLPKIINEDTEKMKNSWKES